MQGTLEEIDIRSLLQLIENMRETGELHIQAVPNSCFWQKKSDLKINFTNSLYGLAEVFPQPLPEKIWSLFFVNGQIIYASDRNYDEIDRSCPSDSGERASSTLALKERLYSYHLPNIDENELSLPETDSLYSEYDRIWILLKKEILKPAQAQQIVSNIIEEILFDLLDLRKGIFSFHRSSVVLPQLTNLETSSLIKKSLAQIKLWKQFFPQIESPEQCPIFKQEEKLRNVLSERAYANFKEWVDGRTSLRQLFRYLNCNPATLAQAIYPYLQKGWLKLTARPLPTNFLQESTLVKESYPQVIYINNNVTIGRNVEYILKLKGCRSILVEEPIQALDLIFQLKPDLILCDIRIPKIDGYELCSMLRNSQSFRATPIIMLTEANDRIDRAKLKIVGASDYLTKPVREHELLMLIEKYLGLSNCPDLPQRLQSLSLEEETVEWDKEFSEVNLTES
jgi:twitching motility two-component system response regulator PilG